MSLLETLRPWIRSAGSLAALFLLCFSTRAAAQEKPESIGIYNLKEIRSVPLNARTIGKTKKGNLLFEEVRFTSVPGVSIYMILSYKIGSRHLPGILVLDRFKAKPKEVEATNGYFGISVAPPSGNFDPQKRETVGGPKLNVKTFSLDDHYTANPNNSYIYHYTVALLRALDYLESRPEVDLSKTIVSGYSWPGLVVTHLHAIDDRPAGYTIYHGLGYYCDPNGLSGGRSASFSRKQYEMYGAGTYAKYGSRPIWVGLALDDYFSHLDSIMEVYKNLNCEKRFAYAPNRHHHGTQRGEFDYPGPYPWQTYWQSTTGRPSVIDEGTVVYENGRVLYQTTLDLKDTLKTAEIYYSFGEPGNWMSRTWHAAELRKGEGGIYQAEIPIYDPKTPFYVVGQIFTSNSLYPGGWVIGNGVQFIEPEKMGVTSANAVYGKTLFDPSQKSDLYLRTGAVKWLGNGMNGGRSVNVNPYDPNDHGMVHFQNIEPQFWKGAKELVVTLKGDGQVGPLNAYLAYDSGCYLDKSAGHYTRFELVPAGKPFSIGWREFVIPLNKVASLGKVSALFLEVAGPRSLQIGEISWR